MRQITAKQSAPPAGSARERADSQYRFHQRGLVRHGERLLVARAAGAVRKMVHGLRPVPPLVTKRRARAAVPTTQGLPTHPHAVRQARRDVSRLTEFRCCLRNNIRFSINRP